MPRNSPAKLEVRIADPDDVNAILALISRAYPGFGNYRAGQVLGRSITSREPADARWCPPFPHFGDWRLRSAFDRIPPLAMKDQVIHAPTPYMS